MPPQGAPQPPPPPPGVHGGQWSYAPAPVVRKTNTMAIIALVCAFVFAPAGLILGILARREIERTHEDGDGMALAAIIISVVSIALTVVMFVAFFTFFAAVISNIPNTTPNTTTNGFSLPSFSLPSTLVQGVLR